MARAKRFWAVASGIIGDKFRTICRDDADIVRESMEQFVKLCFPESEHQEIKELNDEALCDLVTKVSFEHPEVFVAFLEVLKEAVAEFFSQEKAGRQ
ncbi:MAG: hypothetical protein A2134_01175 [Candidatus Woykebacteria bacterium RBG_16_39_9b]|uniref:Uncharacterized protein n=1 Tax=Candidatus Woykebacteria bacterium RBG_16_39_9b TaxID=1802595 RepID=A0A1G1WBU4_9BACT|nr:MAG: hypothetical protein A2134_01175 [Candidatus Woykebacteria bacterium RBG_16_39_9b]